MRNFFWAMNTSGMFGPIEEFSLDLLSPQKRNAVDAIELRVRRHIGRKSPGAISETAQSRPDLQSAATVRL